MVIEELDDSGRQLIISLLTKVWVRVRNDPTMLENAKECEKLISILSGTDTKIKVERAYPSENN